MPFLQIKKDSIYLNVTNNPKLIRPLFLEAVGKWVYNVPPCSRITPQGKKESIRFYRQIDADFSSWMKDNQDPLWDVLDQQDKFDRNGDRQDFSVRPVHLLPVWDYELQDVKIAKFGNQFFEEMVKWYDQGGKVTDCDWMCWTEGSGRRVQYKTSRQDSSPFNFQGDTNTITIKCQELMKRAVSDLSPFKSEEDMIKFLTGATQQESTSFNYGANQSSQSQSQVPNYTPGGQSVTTHGTVPASLPPASLPPANPIPSVNTQQMPVPSTVPISESPVQPPTGNMFGYNSQVPNGYVPSVPASSIPPINQGLTPQVPQVSGGYVPSIPMNQNFAPQVPVQPSGVPVPGTSVTNQSEVPNAPVNNQPIFAPPVQTQSPSMQVPTPPTTVQADSPTVVSSVNEDPANIVINFGKYSGKTLGWILENAKEYLTFLKGNKKEYAGYIEALLGGVNSVSTQPSTQTPVQPSVQQDDNNQRQQLLEQINQKFLNIPDFQGPGIAQNMMPFLVNVIGTTDFSTAPLADLVKLNTAIDQRIVQE